MKMTEFTKDEQKTIERFLYQITQNPHLSFRFNENVQKYLDSFTIIPTPAYEEIEHSDIFDNVSYNVLQEIWYCLSYNNASPFEDYHTKTITAIMASPDHHHLAKKYFENHKISKSYHKCLRYFISNHLDFLINLDMNTRRRILLINKLCELMQLDDNQRQSIIKLIKKIQNN